MNRTSHAVALFLLSASSSASMAQGTLAGDRMATRAWADVYAEGSESDPMVQRLFMGRWVNGAQDAQADWNAGARRQSGSIDFAGHGLRAKGAYDWSHGYDTGSPGPGGLFSDALFDGSVSIEGSWDQSLKAAMSDAATDSWVVFSVDEPTPWTWDAHVEGSSAGDSEAAYSFSLRAIEPGSWNPETGLIGRGFTDPFGDQPYQVSDGRVGGFSEDVFLEGLLPAGTYMLSVNLSARMTGSGYLYAPWSDGFASASMTGGDFHLGGGVPSPSTAIVLALAAPLARRRR